MNWRNEVRQVTKLGNLSRGGRTGAGEDGQVAVKSDDVLYSGHR